MNAEMWISIVAGAFALSTPLVIAAIGESVVERAGRINLGIEGIMILGALAGVWGASLAGPLAGLALAVLTGILCAFIINAAVYRAHANEIVVGLAVTMAGLGLSTFLFQLWVPPGRTNVSVETVPRLDLPVLSDIPVLGPIFFSQGLLFYVAIALLAGVWALGRFTRFGLRVRAVGADASSAELRGIRPHRVGAQALIIGGALAGLAGGAITVGSIGSFTPDITAGRGYIVLAVVIMGAMAPLRVFAGAMLFSLVQSFSLLGQSTSLQLPSEVFQALPYLVTLVVLVVTSRAQLGRLLRAA